jgi:hypothetical protein
MLVPVMNGRGNLGLFNHLYFFEPPLAANRFLLIIK